MLSGASARNKTRECQLAHASVESVYHLLFPSIYRESGMREEEPFVDPASVNVHALLPARFWVQSVMLGLNLAVWLDALARMNG